jgi:hypothetical protein
MIRIDPDIVIRKYVQNRITANKNWLSVLCGPTGSGKSYFSLAVCEKFFPKFTVDNIVFSVKEYLDKFNELDKQRRYGDIILFDEGHEYNARRSMDEKNVMMGEILSMIRFTRISSIFTLPDLRQIDVALVRLMHNYCYTFDIDRKTCPQWQKTRTGVKFYEIMHEAIPRKDSRELPMRYPVMNVVVRNMRTEQLYEKTIKIKELWYNAPSEQLLEDYEKLKRRHFNRALAMSRAKLQAVDMKQRNKLSATGINPDGEDGTPQTPIPQNPAPANTPSTHQETQNAINSILNS